ncbi:uncharacterized protein LOC135923988 isoform X2 [Gordionus sp. m RMFG-2023]|uniref:uncharacterized protein LOC135923988 isoform X2 n=1 Tax=Gordionus sp. m RMFG-2023 TaxID=3053472 RepID=UPI0031FC92F3
MKNEIWDCSFYYGLCHSANLKPLESPTIDKGVDDIAELCLKLDSKLNLKPSKNELKHWFVIMSHSFKSKGATFISRLQNHALLESKFKIFDPTISHIPTFETSIVVKEIEKYSGDLAIPYQMFLIFLPYGNVSLFSTLKNSSSATLIPSQIILESTADDTLPLHNIVPAIINKSRVEIYSNCLADLKILYPREPLDFCDGDSKSGIITSPHIPKYLCRSGTGEVRGNLLLENSPVHLNYEDSSFPNWPTYFAGDKVQFTIKFNGAKTHFAVCNILFSKESFKNSIRYKGTVQKFSSLKHSGIFKVITPGEYCNCHVAFKLNEFILPVEENDLQTYSHNVFQFSIVPTPKGYERAIRIT